MKYGTYTTFDCPCVEGETLQQQENDPKNEELLKKAFEWLTEKFNAIGATVRKQMNPHDFGMYPSFEIDYPHWYEMTSLNQDFEDDDTDLEGDRKRLEEWDDKANAIEVEYNKKFMQ